MIPVRGRPVWAQTATVGGLLGLGMLLRITFLDSDPAYPLWPGYITDEGRWTEVARNWALFREVGLGPLARIHLILAPLYQAMTAISFMLFGVGFSSARLVSALSGLGLLAGAVGLLRTRMSTASLIFVTLVLAIQPDLLFLSRVALPETPAILLEFLAFVLLLSVGGSAMRSLGGGLLTAAALGMKATVAPVVPLFAIAILAADRTETLQRRLLKLGGYGAGVAVPAMIVFAAYTYLSSSGDSGDLDSSVSIVWGFVHSGSAYSFLSELFYEPFSPALNVLLVSAWSIAGIILAHGKVEKGPAWNLYVGSAIWAVGWTLCGAILQYFPERYVFHALVPLSINIGAGFTLLQMQDGEKLFDPATLRRVAGRSLLRLWWCLPLSVLLASISLGLFASPLRLRGDSLSVQLASILLIEVVLVIGLRYQERLGARFWQGLLTAPVVFAPLLLLAERAHVVSGLWGGGSTQALVKGALLILSIVIVSSGSARPGSSSTLRRSAYAYTGLLGLVWVIQIAPTFLTPTYTIRDASSLIGELAGETTVATVRGASLFLGNRLRYREVSLDVIASESPPEMLVVFHPPGPVPPDLYETLAVPQLRLGPLVVQPAPPPKAWIYRLRPTPRQ